MNLGKVKEVQLSDGGIVSTENTAVEWLKYHEPIGEGDKHYVDIKFKDGGISRCFEPKRITFEMEQ